MKKQEEIDSRHRYWLMLQCSFWIYHLFVLVVAFFIFSKMLVAHTKANDIYSTNNYNYSLEAIENWEKGYIIDIKVVNTNNCPEGFSPLINYTWPGTVQGCYCDIDIEDYNVQYILEGTCTSQLIHYGCTKIDALDEQQLKMWKGGKLLCYKRAASLNFYNSTLDKIQEVSLKTCGSGKQYEVNTLPDINCPISDISNVSFGSSQQTLELDTGNSLHFVSQMGYPIADFKLTEYNFCPFFDQINISPNKDGNYVLEIDNYSTTCTGTDPRINEIDFLTEQEFLTNNTRIYDLISALPGYPRPSTSYVYKLGFVPYAVWTNQCRQTTSHSLLAATTHLLFTENTNALNVSLYASIPCLMIIAIIFRAFYCIRKIFENRTKKQYNMMLMTDRQVAEQLPNVNIVKTFDKQFCFFLLEMLFTFGVVFGIGYSLYIFHQESMWIKKAIWMNCSDDHLNGIFLGYEVVVDEIFYIFAVLAVIIIILLAANLAFFIVRVKYGDLYEKEEEKVSEAESAQQLNREEMQDNRMKDLHLQDSSDVILNKEKEELKVYELDNMMGNELGAQETKFNFYASINMEGDGGEVGVPKKKKKKKGVKRKNLFKEEEEKEKEDPI